MQGQSTCLCGCGGQPSRGKQWLHGHWTRLNKLPVRITPLADRLWPKVVRTEGGCWTWTGYIDANGYGAIGTTGKRGPSKRVHRVVFELLRGPIPTGLVLDHLCRNRACVNPDHLDPVTDRENILRGVGATAMHARKTHCKRGHEFTADNTLVRPKGRECITCLKERRRLAWRNRPR